MNHKLNFRGGGGGGEEKKKKPCFLTRKELAVRVRNVINGYGISRGSRTSASGHVQPETNHFLPHLSLLCAGDRSGGVPPARTPGLLLEGLGLLQTRQHPQLR